MSYRIVISSFAAVAIGTSCIADASGGGGYFAAPGVRSMPNISRMGGFAGGGGYFAAPGVRSMPKHLNNRYGLQGVGSGAATATGFTPGFGAPTAGGAAALYYEPASYVSNAACGRYPYPPCKERTKKAKKTPAVEPDD